VGYRALFPLLACSRIRSSPADEDDALTRRGRLCYGLDGPQAEAEEAAPGPVAVRGGGEGKEKEPAAAAAGRGE
jgi:hypothetical protein